MRIVRRSSWTCYYADLERTDQLKNRQLSYLRCWFRRRYQIECTKAYTWSIIYQAIRYLGRVIRNYSQADRESYFKVVPIRVALTKAFFTLTPKDLIANKSILFKQEAYALHRSAKLDCSNAFAWFRHRCKEPQWRRPARSTTFVKDLLVSLVLGYIKVLNFESTCKRRPAFWS